MTNVNNLTYSANGLKLTEEFESLSLNAYQDGTGVWTNGDGNTHNVTPGSTITAAQATSDLAANVEGAAYVVNTVVTTPLNQNQFDALVDFVFNLGSGNFQSSTLLRKLNNNDFVGASQEFPKWNHAGGVVVDGLTRRRLAEQVLFNTPTVVNQQPTAPVVSAGIPPNSGDPQPSVTEVISNAENWLSNLQDKLP